MYFGVLIMSSDAKQVAHEVAVREAAKQGVDDAKKGVSNPPSFGGIFWGNKDQQEVHKAYKDAHKALRR